MAATALNKNRAIRQKALREQLAQGGHVQHVLDIAKQLSEQDALEPKDIQRLRAAADIKLKLISKYLPDLKSMELVGDEDRPIALARIERAIVDPTDKNA